MIKKIGGKDEFFAEDMKVRDFAFDEKVAAVFDDMVSRSVPLYGETMQASLNMARHFVRSDSNVYDIGSSTGTLLLSLAEMIGDPSVNYVGVDNSASMIQQAEKKVAESDFGSQVSFMEANIEKPMGLENASIVFMNYTLQFVRPLQRENVVQQIYDGLKPNGALILVEKVLGNDSLFNRLYIDLYYQYKATVGYSDKEIRQKREALENVLIPYRMDENFDLLERCGFKSVDVFFKWCNFAGIVAVKTE